MEWGKRKISTILLKIREELASRFGGSKRNRKVQV